MAELVGGALLSAFLKSLFGRLASEGIPKLFCRKESIVKLLDELNTVLISANKLLNDAEEKQITDEEVRKWLDKLKDVVYRADDLVDAIDSEALRQKVEEDQSNSNISTSRVVKKFHPTKFSRGFDNMVKNEATEILRRLKILLDQKDALGLKEGVERPLPSQRPPAPLAEESSVYGMMGHKEAIVDLLLSSDGGDDKISVIPIVGMGGIGKTTLAQLVYDDDRVKNHFEIKAWVTVSDDFDIFKITKEILVKVTSEECLIGDLFELQQNLREALRGKKFLFVHDDVWNENYQFWDSLKSCFESGADGSKIVVTTRSTIVASVMGGREKTYHQLTDLSPEDSWKLFTRHAFVNNEDRDAHQDLQATGREIVKKCKGLPLAIKSIGGLLRSERNPKRWESILESDVWDELYRKKSNILPALWLSYRHMPTHLKSCFSYCSMFPKDYEFVKENIILLWMAEGFLQSDKQSMTMEEIGEEYIEDMISRSLLQKSSEHESIFLMHDLVHDLTMFVSGDFSFKLDYSNDLHDLARHTRHLSYTTSFFELEKIMEGICNAKGLRTFIGLPLLVKCGIPKFPIKFRHELLLSSGRSLWVLCLRGSPIKKLCSSIGNLIHLRYLDLSYSLIRQLPSSVCTLYNLQTLLLADCKCLIALPKNMEMLINLRHLDIAGVPLKETPPQLYQMKSLQTLSKLVVGEIKSGHTTNTLKNVQPFCGRLEISALENVGDTKEALGAHLKDTKTVTELSLIWSSTSFGNAISLERERDLLDSLRPRTDLRHLVVESYRGTLFSDWVGHDSFSEIVVIRLENCKNCRLLPPLGQLPSLQVLMIRGFHSVVAIGDEFYGNGPSFRCLRTLQFREMLEWNEWSFGAVFPCLVNLILIDCPKLRISFPNNLPFSNLENPRTVFPSLDYVGVDSCRVLEMILDMRPHSNLKRLSIVNCKKISQWDLLRISGLENLCITDCEDHTFPLDGLLPTSLTSISIYNCRNLAALNGKVFQQLTSLQRLFIYDCPKLRRLPGEGLPASLYYFSSKGCPLLKKQCEKDKGKDWPKISHIG